MPTNIEGRLKKLAVDEMACRTEDLEPETELISLTDSLGLVELLYKVEDEFGITIPDEEAESIQTFNDLVEIVGRKLSKTKTRYPVV
ncbi:MAG: acyl carrier protein [Patescibacteria group bacterium]|nr:acyl carrier protein [Patescibacteria group bacterium]